MSRQISGSFGFPMMRLFNVNTIWRKNHEQTIKVDINGGFFWLYSRLLCYSSPQNMVDDILLGKIHEHRHAGDDLRQFMSFSGIHSYNSRDNTQSNGMVERT